MGLSACARPSRARPGLAIPYDLASFSPMEIAESAGDLCEIVWVVDTSSDGLGDLGPMLSRLGTVVDAAGRPTPEVAAELARLAPKGIVTFSHSQLRRCAELAGALGLVSNPPEVVGRCVDKHEQRLAFALAGLACPRLVELELGPGGRLLRGDPSAVDFPAVLKPRSGMGSIETYLVPTAEALSALCDPTIDGEPVAPGEYLLEEYLPSVVPPGGGLEPVADYVSVESVVVDGVVRHLSVTGKFPLAEPLRETGNFLPSALPPATGQAVEALASEAIAALGIWSGCLHTEIKLTPAGPRVIELNPRVGGGGISDLFALRTGVSLLRLAVLTALGEPVPALGASAGVVYSLFLQPPTWASKLTAVEGLAEAAAVPGVRRISLNREPPVAVNWRNGSLGYLASVVGVASDHAELVERRARLMEVLRPVFD